MNDMVLSVSLASNRFFRMFLAICPLVFFVLFDFIGFGFFETLLKGALGFNLRCFVRGHVTTC